MGRTCASRRVRGHCARATITGPVHGHLYLSYGPRPMVACALYAFAPASARKGVYGNPDADSSLRCLQHSVRPTVCMPGPPVPGKGCGLGHGFSSYGAGPGGTSGGYWTGYRASGQGGTDPMARPRTPCHGPRAPGVVACSRSQDTRPRFWRAVLHCGVACPPPPAKGPRPAVPGARRPAQGPRGRAPARRPPLSAPSAGSAGNTDAPWRSPPGAFARIFTAPSPPIPPPGRRHDGHRPAPPRPERLQQRSGGSPGDHPCVVCRPAGRL